MKHFIFRLLIIYFCFLSIIIINGCCGHDMDRYEVNLSSIEIFNIDNSGSSAIVSSTNIIPERAYQLKVMLSANTKMAQNFQAVFCNSAYAFVDCIDEEYKYINYPKNIEIYSLHNFDTLHPAGTLLNDYFLNSGFASTLSEEFEKGYHENHNYFDSPSSYYLSLMKVPKSDSIQQFYVKIFCSDGLVLSDTASPVKFIKI